MWAVSLYTISDILDGPVIFIGVTIMSDQLLTQSTNASIRYTVGRVAADKKPDSRIISVFVKDLLPMYEGSLKPLTSEHQLTGKDWKGDITLTNTIEAEWMSDESNRRFPPDVKVGEQVDIIIYTDQNKVFWKSKGRDDDRRRTERIFTAAANTPDNPAPVTKENSYGICIDTLVDKTVTLYTSNTAGEQFKYMVKADGKDGSIGLWDDDNNEIKIESAVPRVYLKNKDGCLFELAKKNVTIVAPEDLLIKVGRQAVFDIPVVKMINTKKGGITVWEAAELAIKANSMLVTAQCIGLQGNVEADNIVSGPIHSTGYSTILGKGYRSYKSPDVNEKSPAATRANNTANMDGGGGTNRHCAAWEDVQSALSTIAGDLRRIDGKIGYGNNAGAVEGSAASSKMPVNRGQ